METTLASPNADAAAPLAQAATSAASQPPPEDTRQRCFAPVVDGRTRLLILGSLPGVQSLAKAQYYGNRQNAFWRLMSEVLERDLVGLDYAARLQALLAQGVGLWDVVAEARRAGSLDSAIRQRDDNDLPALLARYPAIQTIGFNGGMAAKLGLKILGVRAAHYHIVALPSSSPAYTLPYAEKCLHWQKLKWPLQEANHRSGA
ncbi:DNA-deoxyinosine glycosylase [Duganella qianjiadongensis]|uniref:DNA-deoxyinosine glycosylase n=1 Tax=Duganella qianjiadongensis TaxID=2692176 RepID=A0ABW9VKW1_9BURK|nr:DNA-deoxyinosine glycosylase [Duganella qianjiadongensis]MYM40249.1 DNA-deoxyinosine glycosylase [Duganella qianjiadongensis]